MTIKGSLKKGYLPGPEYLSWFPYQRASFLSKAANTLFWTPTEQALTESELLLFGFRSDGENAHTWETYPLILRFGGALLASDVYSIDRLSKESRAKIITLITIDVHGRDVVQVNGSMEHMREG